MTSFTSNYQFAEELCFCALVYHIVWSPFTPSFPPSQLPHAQRSIKLAAGSCFVNLESKYCSSDCFLLSF